MSSPTVVCFDIETTGLDPQRHQIVEVAGVKFTLDGDEQGIFAELANPGMTIPTVASAIHGITNAQISAAAPSIDVLQRFFTWCGDDAMLVAHNAPFDAGFVVEAFVRHGQAVPQNTIVDSLAWAASKLKSRDNSLSSLCRSLGADPVPAHRALADAMMLRLLFEHLCSLYKQPLSMLKRKAVTLAEMGRPEPATPDQIKRLRSLGVSADALTGYTRLSASELIDQLSTQPNTASEAQLGYLKDLGATATELVRLSRRAASALIDQLKREGRDPGVGTMAGARNTVEIDVSRHSGRSAQQRVGRWALAAVIVFAAFALATVMLM